MNIVQKQKFLISLKSTLPTYLIISSFTMLFLREDSVMSSFSSFGTSFFAKVFFSLAFNLLYFIPQFTGVFIGLHTLRKTSRTHIDAKKAKWFLRIPAPLSALTTLLLILIYKYMGFFPQNTDLKNLTIILIIILLLNIVFSLIITLKIYSVLSSKVNYLQKRKKYSDKK